MLTHDARFDEPALGPALRSPARTSARWAAGGRRMRAAARLLNAGYTEDEIGRIRGPLGLDIGAITPAETAVSILAEVLAVRAGPRGRRAVTEARPDHRSGLVRDFRLVLAARRE